MTTIRKSDCIFFAVVLSLAVFIFATQILTGNGRTGYVTVRVDGELTASYDLAVSQEVSLNGGTNTLRIEDGKADIIWADCPDKICVRQREISRNRESIICLPNKVVVEVIDRNASKKDGSGTDATELDAVTN